MASLPPAGDAGRPAFLREQAMALLAFYLPRAINPAGGYYTAIADDGEVLDRSEETLVQTCRYAHNFALAYRLGFLPTPDPALHGIARLRTAFRDPVHGGYRWTLAAGRPAREDRRKLAYGHAFVLLAAASAVSAGIGADDLLADVAAVLETRFWEPAAGLYADEASEDWRIVDSYRGQNANMHLVEALLAAADATGDGRFRERARAVAQRVIDVLMARAGGHLWEHYRADWSPDFEYNRATPRDLLRPYGVLPGHLLEWAKLLTQLDQATPAPWLRERAAACFAAATDAAWDTEHGGFFYALERDGTVVDDAKYQWVMAEAIGASVILATTTGDTGYWAWYRRVWAYVLARIVDRERGGWYAALTREGRRLELPFTRGKSDFYHPFGAITLALALAERPAAAGGGPASAGTGAPDPGAK